MLGCHDNLVIQLYKLVTILPRRPDALRTPGHRRVNEDVPERSQSPRSASKRGINLSIHQLNTTSQHPLDDAVHAGPNLVSDVVLHLLSKDGLTALNCLGPDINRNIVNRSISRNVGHLNLPVLRKCAQVIDPSQPSRYLSEDFSPRLRYVPN
jgi:hypothetical protein